MSARDKIDAALAYLKERKVKPATAAPPLWRLCWRRGFHIPPPHFLGFFPIMFLTGSVFAGAIGFVFTAAQLVGGLEPDRINLALSCGAGAFFGGAMATSYRWSAIQMGLPDWAEFDAHTDEPDETW